MLVSAHSMLILNSQNILILLQRSKMGTLHQPHRWTFWVLPWTYINGVFFSLRGERHSVFVYIRGWFRKTPGSP